MSKIHKTLRVIVAMLLVANLLAGCRNHTVTPSESVFEITDSPGDGTDAISTDTLPGGEGVEIVEGSDSDFEDDTGDTVSPENIKHTESTESTEETKSTEETEPIEDTKSAEGTEPPQGTEPTEETKPVEGTQLSESTEPTEDVEPTEGTEPTEGAAPDDGPCCDYGAYLEMSPAEQQAYMNTFSSPLDFIEWCKTAEAEHTDHDDSVTVEGGDLDIGDYID